MAEDPITFTALSAGSGADMVERVRVDGEEVREVRCGPTGEAPDCVGDFGDIAVGDGDVGADPGLYLPVGAP